jgi:cobalt-zinc-cadmium efflux system outer membrane protein
MRRTMRRWRSWKQIALVAALILCQAPTAIAAPEAPAAMPRRGVPPPLRLTLDEAQALFLSQNLDLLMARFGIDSARGQQITARLFPNPSLYVSGIGSFLKQQFGEQSNITRSGQIVTMVTQLFEMAGKRGFRIESAAFGTQAAEMGFEDALRQLSFTVKDTYYRVQLALRRLALAEENRDRFTRILDVNSIRFKKGYIAEIDLIRIRLQIIDFQSQVIQAIQDAESARADLRVLLRLKSVTPLELTTELEYQRVDPDIEALHDLAMDSRPDIRVKRVTVAQRQADLKLARAYAVPDVTVGAGYGVQGPVGPDLQNQAMASLSVPLPLFNRNQGGIVQADVAVQAAQADLDKTVSQVDNQVEAAYQTLIQSRRLVETYLGGVLDDAKGSFSIVERAYEKGGATILDLLDAARTARTIQQNYIEALFGYQRNIILLESAVGRQLPP